jgi:transcription initiation factor TFIIH subunit 2
MPPRRIQDGYMDVDSDESDVSILDDEPGPRKNKGKGKAIDRGKDKAKNKVKEVRY